MKKFGFMLLCVAAVTFAACEKKGKNTEEPKDKESSYVCPITIDGTGAEYDALPNAIVENCNADCGGYQGLKVAKVYSDEVYTCVYLEFDPEEFPLSIGGEDPEAGAQIHIYTSDVNVDTKNGFIGQNTTPMQYCYEGVWLVSGVAEESVVVAPFEWPAETASSNGWPWVEATTGSNPINESVITAKSLEIKMFTSSILGATGSYFYMAVDLQDNWESVGVLPNAADVTTEEGTTAVLAPAWKVVINAVEE